MTLHVLDAELAVFEVGNTATTRGSEDTTVPNGDIQQASITSRIQDSRDRARFVLENDGGTYNDLVTIGDRVQFYTKLEGENSLSRRWTGMVVDRQIELGAGGKSRLTLTLEDFIFAVLGRRFATYAYEERQLAGPQSAVVNDLVNTNASELGTGEIDTFSAQIDLELQRTNLLDALGELAKRYDAVLSSAGIDVSFKKRGELPVEFQLRQYDRRGTLTASETNRDMVNDVVVDGARESGLDIEQTAFDSHETVTNSNRRTQQVDVRKAEIASIELHIQKNSTDDDLLVRIQADDGNGNPKDPTDETSDLSQAKIPPNELPSDDWYKVEMPDNSLPDPNPHILVEATGSTGHGVGYDSGTSDLAYRVNYWYPVTPSAVDPDSIDNNRRHEGRYRRETIRGDAEGSDIAKGIINRRAKPRGTVKFGADSPRSHNLDPGEVVYVNEPAATVDADYVVYSKRDRYTGMSLGTSIELRTKRNI